MTFIKNFYLFIFSSLQIFNIRHPTSDIRHPTSDFGLPTSDLGPLTSDFRSNPYLRSVEGTVIKSTGNQYRVLLENGEIRICKIRGNLRLQDFEATNPLTVGDKVDVDYADLNND